MTRALVIGGGPAGLMAAEVLAEAGVSVIICDAKPSFGRKFLMAGKSGLNLTKDEPLATFMRHYASAEPDVSPMIADFTPVDVMAWTRGLGQEVFTGTSGRVFPRAMKASPLLRAWLARLDLLGVQRRTRHRWIGWEGQGALFDTPQGQQTLLADVIILALGGASWSRLGSDGAWADTLRKTGVSTVPFAPSNSGVTLPWSVHMRPHFGQALKAVSWRAGEVSSRGEAVLSARGLEGSGVYALTPSLRNAEPFSVDLVPDLAIAQLAKALAKKPQKLRLAHWLRNTLRLPAVKSALFFESYAQKLPLRADWPKAVKSVPLRYTGLHPMDEAISTAGGVGWDSLSADLMLKARPGVFCAGEMLDWEAPTGGYLLTACFATGRRAGEGALRYLANAA